MFKPQNIETAWIETEKSIVEIMTKKKWIKPFLLFSAVAFAYFSFDLWTQTRFPQWSRFNLVQDRLWAAYVVIFSSFLPLFVTRFRNSKLFLMLVLALSWLLPIYAVGAIGIASSFPIIYLFLSSVVVASDKINRWIKLITVVVLFLGLVSLITRDIINSQNHKVLLYFSNIHMDLSLLYFIGAIFNKVPFTFLMHFNPLQFISPSPLPESTQTSQNSSDYEKQCFRGWLGIVQTQIIFLIIIGLLKLDSIANTQNPLIHYLFFILTITGAIKVVSSILWIYGFQSPSSTYFIILAKTPIEIWQRGAVFIADFLFNKIYLPTWKMFRRIWLSSMLSVLAILFHLFIFHEWIVKSVLRIQFGNMLFGNFGWLETKQWGLWISVWLVWIFLFLGVTKLSKPFHSYALFQWVMVLITHLGSAMTLPIATYLLTII